MKIATYHRRLGDEVTFFKGNIKEFVLSQIVKECIDKLILINKATNWNEHYAYIQQYIKKKNVSMFEERIFQDNPDELLLQNSLDYYRSYYYHKKYYKEPRFDRVYVTSLFTFYFKITVQTINEAKHFVKSLDELKVGGVAATLIPELIEKETGICPFKGLLDKPYMLDEGVAMIVDELPLDYSILYEIDYKYPTDSAYFTFMTKGCTRKCAFCAVPKLEPIYIPKVESVDKFNEIKKNVWRAA